MSLPHTFSAITTQTVIRSVMGIIAPMEEKLERRTKITETREAANNGNSSQEQLELQESSSHGAFSSEQLERQKDALASRRLRLRAKFLYALFWIIGLALLLYCIAVLSV